MALAAQQVGVLTTLDLTLESVTPEGIRIAPHRTIPLLEHTARAATAQVELRTRAGATSDSKLIPQTDRAISTALGQAALDFGIAVFSGPAADTMPLTQGVIGTPAYMAPEQVRGEEPDARSDARFKRASWT